MSAVVTGEWDLRGEDSDTARRRGVAGRGGFKVEGEGWVLVSFEEGDKEGKVGEGDREEKFEL